MTMNPQELYESLNTLRDALPSSQKDEFVRTVQYLTTARGVHLINAINTVNRWTREMKRY